MLLFAGSSYLPGGAESGGRNLRRIIQGLCSTRSEINDYQINIYSLKGGIKSEI